MDLRRWLVGIGVVSLMVGALSGPAAAGPATERIREFFGNVNRVITNPSDDRPAEERLAEMRSLVTGMIEFRTAAQLALGAEWAARTPAQQDEFVALFADLLQTSVFGSVGGRARLDNGLTVNYLGESREQDDVVVATTVLARKGTEIAVRYRMMSREGRWMVHDVAVDGVSLVENYRAQFHKVIQRSSYAGLVGEMRSRLVELGRGTTLVAAPGPAEALPPAVALDVPALQTTGTAVASHASATDVASEHSSASAPLSATLRIPVEPASTDDPVRERTAGVAERDPISAVPFIGMARVAEPGKAAASTSDAPSWSAGPPAVGRPTASSTVRPSPPPASLAGQRAGAAAPAARAATASPALAGASAAPAAGRAVTASPVLAGAQAAPVTARPATASPAVIAERSATAAPVIAAPAPARPASPAPAAKPKPANEGAVRSSAEPTYWVQVGAFRTDEAAINAVNALQGEDVSMMQSPDDPLLRVLVGPFASRQAAATKLRSIRARGLDGFVAERPR